jgi:hypothetical protein
MTLWDRTAGSFLPGRVCAFLKDNQCFENKEEKPPFCAQNAGTNFA